jgi:glycerol-3-phosphate cytidylyltransferase
MIKGKKIIVTAGTFDLLHSGHINILKKARELGDFLIVLVSTNACIKSYKDCAPIMNYTERAQLVAELKCVDMVLPQRELVSIEQFKELEADLFVLGDDWKNNHTVKGIEWLRKQKKIVFFPYTKHLSSSKIKEKIIKHSYEIIKAQVKK